MPRTMKDSGIKWAPIIADSFTTKRLKYILFDRNEKNNPVITNNILSLTAKQGVVPLEEKEGGGNKPKEDLSLYRVARPGDIVMNCMNVISGSVAMSNYFGCLSPVYYTFRTINPEDEERFFNYIFQTTQFQRSLVGFANGILIKESSNGKLNTIRLRVSVDMLGSLVVPYTSPKNQKLIADYLDHKSAEIDALSADIQSEIDTLEAYKRSVITETVTKGLNPNAHMKDSGTGWMGDVPESWNKTRVKYCLKEVNERSIAGEEEPLSMSQKMGLVPTTMINVPHIMATYVGAKIARPNDLVLNKLKAHLGVFSVSQYTGLVSPDYAVYKAYDNTNPKYLEYLFKTDACINEFKKYITGVGQGLSRLYTKDLFRIAIVIPSCDEQDCIVDYLNRKSAEIDAIVKQKQEQLALLADYKKSLIYEYVTGKKEIPDKDI